MNIKVHPTTKISKSIINESSQKSTETPGNNFNTKNIAGSEQEPKKKEGKENPAENAEKKQLLDDFKKGLSSLFLKKSKTDAEIKIEAEIKQILSKTNASIQEIKSLEGKLKAIKETTQYERKHEENICLSIRNIKRQYNKEIEEVTCHIIKNAGASSESNPLTSEFLEKNKLKKFNSFVSRKLELTKEDDSGRTWLGIDINHRKRIFIREVVILNGKPEQVSEWIGGIFQEREITSKLKKTKNCHYFCEHRGLYYTINDENKIFSLISIVELGSGTLHELISTRKTSKNKERLTLYDEDELVSFMVSVQNILSTLQENRIYHSDIKPENIVYNEDEKTYQLMNFYQSFQIPPETDIVDLEEFANVGNERYISPEKSKYWECLRSGKEEKCNEDVRKFNPFKCDLWSFSEIIKELSKEGGEIVSSLKEKLAEMSKIDWKERAEAQKLNFIDSENVFSDFQNYEEEYFKIIRSNMKKNTEWGSVYRRYEDPVKIEETLECIEAEIEQEIKANNGGTDGKGLTLSELKYKKAWRLRVEGKYESCIDEAKACIGLLQKVFDQNNDKDLIIDIISMKIVLADAVANSKKEYNEALQIIEDAYNFYKKHFPEEETAFLGEILLFKGQFLIELKNFEQAKQVLAEDVKVFENSMGGLINKNCGYVLQTLALALVNSGEVDKAVKLLEEALLIKKIIYKTEDNIDVADTMYQLSHTTLKSGSILRAKGLAEKVLDIYKEIYKNEEHLKVRSASNLLKKIEEEEEKGFNPEGMFFFF